MRQSAWEGMASHKTSSYDIAAARGKHTCGSCSRRGNRQIYTDVRWAAALRYLLSTRTQLAISKHTHHTARCHACDQPGLPVATMLAEAASTWKRK